MSDKEVALLTGKLPAHLKQLSVVDDDDSWESGTASGFPVLSTKGKVFHVKRGDDVELVTKPDDDEEAETRLKVIILKTNKGVSRTYYEDAYEEGSDDPPTCYSNDGITPAADAEDRQCKTCAACPHSQWGSRITEAGKKGKACSEVKRLAVSQWLYPNEPMLLRIPPTSLKNWDNYTKMIRKRGVHPTHVVTEIRFDPSVSHQVLQFKVVGFVTEDMVAEVQEALNDPTIDQIVGAAFDPGDAGVPDVPDKPEKPTKQPAKQPAKKPATQTQKAADEDAPAEKPTRTRKRPAKPQEDPPEDDESAEADEDGDGLDDLDLDDLDFSGLDD